MWIDNKGTHAYVHVAVLSIDLLLDEVMRWYWIE